MPKMDQLSDLLSGIDFPGFRGKKQFFRYFPLRDEAAAAAAAKGMQPSVYIDILVYTSAFVLLFCHVLVYLPANCPHAAKHQELLAAAAALPSAALESATAPMPVPAAAPVAAPAAVPVINAPAPAAASALDESEDEDEDPTPLLFRSRVRLLTFIQDYNHAKVCAVCEKALFLKY